MKPIRCADASRAREEPTYGTLGNFQLGMFIEGFRPFPRLALAAVAPALAERNIAYWDRFMRTGEGLHPRILPIRAGRGVPACDGIRVIFCLPTAAGRVIQLVRVVGSYRELLDFDLESMLRHADDLAVEHDETTRILVCTHGKVDPCCALHGNALYRSLDASDIEVWHGAHFGGCRFAGNLWCLTTGNCYGHVEPSVASALLAAEKSQRLFPSGYRGRIGQSPAEAAAEYLIRTDTQTWQRCDCTITELTEIGDAEWRVEACVRGRRLDYRLTASPGPEARLTCRAQSASAPLRYSIEKLPATASPNANAEGPSPAPRNG